MESVRGFGPKLGSLRLRIVVRLDSELVSRLKTRELGSTLLEARLGLLKAGISQSLCLSQLGDRLSAARHDSLSGALLISARGSGSAWN